MAEIRESGYYWMSINGKPSVIAYYDRNRDEWLVPGKATRYPDCEPERYRIVVYGERIDFSLNRAASTIAQLEGELAELRREKHNG